MKFSWKTLGAVVAAQLVLLGAFLAIERARRPPNPQDLEPGEAARRTLAVDLTMPELELRRWDGDVFRLSEVPQRPLLLHVWATWCPPCREELPDLLARTAGDTFVLAISLDTDRHAVADLLDQDVPPHVVFADADAIRDSLDVTRLPVTFVVTRNDRIRLRMEGPRDWSAPATWNEVNGVARQVSP